MWKKVHVLVILALIYPVIDCRKNRKKDSAKSTKCPRTNSKAFRYCTKRTCTLNGDCKSNEKCLCDGDCGMSCVRNNLKCQPPPKPKNSKQKLSKGFNFGSVVTYRCTGQYKVRGSATRTCRAIGQWDGRKARCRVMCDDPGDIAFGNRRYDGFQAGKTVIYWCYDAYELVGSPRMTCQNNGRWSASKPKCELPRCNPPRFPDEAIVIHPRKMPKKFKHSDTILLKCKDGYFKSGIGALKCKKGDIWTGGITCSPKSCGRPKAIPHGKIIGYVYSFKEKVRYTCNEGYKLRGPAYRQCQANEKWSGSDPTCNAVDCGPLNAPVDGTIIERVAYTYGHRIVFECKSPGYEMKGSKIRTCQSDGQWSGSLTTCEIVKCGDPGTPANGIQKVKKGFVYGGSVTFVCNKDYILKGTDTTYCRADKSWNSPVPRCLAPCHSPGVPYQGYRIGQDFRHGQTVRFTCPRNHVMEGVAAITCSDGRWDNNKPSCKAPCKEPADPAHGFKRGQGFKHGHSVTFYCRDGYQRVGAASITCNDGKWNSQNPVCKGICGRPRTSPGVRLLGNSYLDGDRVTFSCDKNLDLFGKAELRCVGRAWDSSEPECKARCTFKGPPEHGFYVKGARNKGDKIKHGERITYKCSRDYTLVGNNAQECNNGWWTNAIPSCKASCQNPGRVKHGVKIGNDYGHGKTVRYQCDGNYILEGKDQLTCHDGKWNFDLPKCKAPCNEPAAPSFGRKRGKDFRHGHSVNFLCRQGYQIIGAVSITCNNGTWNDQVPVCKGFCGRPRTPGNVNLHGNSFLDGDVVTFTCTKNHDLVGNAALRCVGQAWNSSVPECKGQCIFDGTPLNGRTLNRFLVKGATLKHNSIVEFSCDSSYELTGSKVLHCKDGQWNATTPSCKASCGDPGLIDRGRRIGNDFSHGQIVTYQCRQGYRLEGSQKLKCNNGHWDAAAPQCKECGRALGMENYTIPDSSITSPGPHYFDRFARYARLNGRLSWCASGQQYLQVDLGKTYKVTSIVTQGGRMDTGGKWVEEYKVAFYAGAKRVMYSESGKEKSIQGNRDASSVVKYHLKEPFVTRKLRIYPGLQLQSFCLRMEIYGCNPNPECILPGSVFWGLWTRKDNSLNYYRAFIQKITASSINFLLQVDNKLRRTYNRTEPVLVVDKIPKMKEISVNSSVIAVHISGRTEWYRAGNVTDTNEPSSLAKVRFKNGDKRWVPLKELRLVKRPKFCVDRV